MQCQGNMSENVKVEKLIHAGWHVYIPLRLNAGVSLAVLPAMSNVTYVYVIVENVSEDRYEIQTKNKSFVWTSKLNNNS